MAHSVLRCSAFSVLVLLSNVTHAIGLGSINVQSELNQALQASIPLLGFNTEDISNLNSTCIKARLETPDGAFIMMLQTAVARDAQPLITITSRQGIVEPAASILVDVSCTARMRRNYQILLDPPLLLASVLDIQQPKSSAITSTDISSQTNVVKKITKAKSATSADTPKTRKSRRSLLQNTSPEEIESETISLNSERQLNKRSKKPLQSVLRLSANGSPFPESNALLKLKTSDQLSSPSNQSDPKKLEELRAAQARLSALLAGNDPSQEAENRIKSMQEKIQGLQLEVKRATQQSQTDKMSLKAAQEKLFSVNWILGLGGVVLACLVAIGLLMRRQTKQQNTNPAPWWENKTAINAQESTEPSFLPDESEPESPAKPAAGKAEAAPVIEEKNTINFYAAPAISTPMKDVKGVGSDENNTLDPTHFSGNTEGLKAEELSGGIEEAEFWMSLQLPQRAIEILEQHTQGNRPASPMPWLYLLDLYRETGDEKKYTASLKQFEELFNVKGASWNEASLDKEQSKLEDFPHLIKEICDLWNTKSIIPFLENLLYDNREGIRDGFDLPVYRDIMMLVSVAIELSHESNQTNMQTE